MKVNLVLQHIYTNTKLSFGSISEVRGYLP